MKTLISALALATSLSLAGAALAQPSGGPDAKGNAPLKHAHTVNDGSAKRGANSFTQKQAMEHIAKSGFTGVTGLAKGDDGVWRGQAMRDGQTVNVAMDFKGNVSTVPAAGAATGVNPSSAMTTDAAAGRTASSTTTDKTATSRTTTSASAAPTQHHHRRHEVAHLRG